MKAIQSNISDMKLTRRGVQRMQIIHLLTKRNTTKSQGVQHLENTMCTCRRIIKRLLVDCGMRHEVFESLEFDDDKRSVREKNQLLSSGTCVHVGLAPRDMNMIHRDRCGLLLGGTRHLVVSRCDSEIMKHLV